MQSLGLKILKYRLGWNEFSMTIAFLYVTAKVEKRVFQSMLLQRTTKPFCLKKPCFSECPGGG